MYTAVKSENLKALFTLYTPLIVNGLMLFGKKKLCVKQSKERNLDRHQKMNSISENFIIIIIIIILFCYGARVELRASPMQACDLPLSHILGPLIATVVNNENKIVYRGISAISHIPFSQL